MSRRMYEKFHEKSTAVDKVIDDNNFTYVNLLKALKPHIRILKKSSSILDIGCGTGAISFYLASKGFNVLGIDISKRAIKICKQTAKSLKLRKHTQFIADDFQKIKITEKFSLIFCNEVLEHLVNDKHALEKIKGLLSPKGLLFISVPSLNAPLYRIGFARKFDERVGHLRRYNCMKLKKLIRKEKYLILKITKTEGILRNFLFLSRLNVLIKYIKGYLVKIFSAIDNLTVKLLGESQIILVARKL